MSTIPTSIVLSPEFMENGKDLFGKPGYIKLIEKGVSDRIDAELRAFITGEPVNYSTEAKLVMDIFNRPESNEQ